MCCGFGDLVVKKTTKFSNFFEFKIKFTKFCHFKRSEEARSSKRNLFVSDTQSAGSLLSIMKKIQALCKLFNENLFGKIFMIKIQALCKFFAKASAFRKIFFALQVLFFKSINFIASLKNKIFEKAIFQKPSI
ncbi:hypothetical protein DMC01_07635 [Campylobacter troglodytis]|nr:hypothetical protein DMC01_07635 [Campylobacter troglodytis]